MDYSIMWGASVDDPTGHARLGEDEREVANKADAIIREEQPRYAELLHGVEVVAVYRHGTWKREG